MLKQTLLAAVVAASLGMVAAPSTAAPVSVSINVGPPAVRYEAVPAARRGYDWTPGYWNWNANRNRHNWVAGTWMRSRPGYVYAQPTWVQHDGRWQQQRGAWARGDRDHDGLRNDRDRDRDGDGVPNRRDNAPDNPRRK
jgi:hypothetical protein